MTMWTRRTAPLALAALVLIALAATGTQSALPGLEALSGSGPAKMASLWGCGVCVGKGALLASSGLGGMVAFLAVSANLASISACVGMCYMAFAT